VVGLVSGAGLSRGSDLHSNSQDDGNNDADRKQHIPNNPGRTHNMYIAQSVAESVQDTTRWRNVAASDSGRSECAGHYFSLRRAVVRVVRALKQISTAR
jgi:hypothetical protein